jgi:phosphoglycolate phosphatase
LIRLVLFDIDGTLLDSGDLSRRCFLRVLRQFVAPQAVTDQASLAGKTDPQIMRELLLDSGLSAEQAGTVMPEALLSYQSLYLAGLKDSGIRPLGGAKELIERLAAVPPERLLLGILSGNMEGLVVPKLEAVGIRASNFVVGAFGSDDADRGRLPSIAVEKARRRFGVHVPPHEVAIVGDTPLDVKCAKDFGAVSIAVATGGYTCKQLEATGPTYLLESLLAWTEGLL